MSAERYSVGRTSAVYAPWLKYAVEVSIIAVAYLVLAKFSLELASINPSATPIWPPTGFALAATLLLGYKVCPAIFAAAFVANVTTAGSLSTSLAIAIGNTLESAVGAYLINHWSNGFATFDTPAGVGRFALISFLPSTAVSATVGVLSLSVAGYADWAKFGPIWLTWWTGDLAGALLIAPVIVLWAKSDPASLRGQALARSFAAFATAIVIGLIAFSPLARYVPNSSPLTFLAIVPLMWTALRHDQRDTATIALILACFAVWGVIAGGGPFARGNLNESFLLLLAFMISISVPSLALSADVATHARHERRIEAIMHEISHRSKNLLAVVQSIARQVTHHSTTFADFEAAFSSRIGALANMHDLLLTQNWYGADIRDVFRAQLEPFQQPNERRLKFGGPEFMLNSKAVEQIGMVLHELATNATKHGALSVPSGRVNIRWAFENADGAPQRLRIEWQETAGPPVTVPERKGFGHMVVTNLVAQALDGNASIDFPIDGLKWTLVVPAANVRATKVAP